MIEENEYRTRDLGEAAALLTLDQELIRIVREGKVCWFIFGDRDKCERLANDYLFGRCLIDGRTFYEAISKLKNRIFQFE